MDDPSYAMLIPPALGGSGLNNSFLISEKLMNFTILDRVIQECTNDKYYHKVMVYGEEEYRRDLILKTLLDFVEPVTFSPVLFKKEGTNCSFFIKSCQDVLMKFISGKFVVIIPNKVEKKLKVEIICNFITVESLEVVNTNNLSDVLRTRYEPSTKNLDLSCFCDDESLLEYCPLYLSRNMIAVMAQVSHYNLKGIHLQYNHLKDTSSFYSLQKGLERLDLRNNQIQSLKDLAFLKRFTKLKSLYLDGNPLCALYDNYNYIIEIKSLCNSLQFIDGIRIESPPVCQQNFLCRLESREFADRFMEMFFTQYDSDNRATLTDLYDKNALLSVSATVAPHQNTSKDVILDHYGLKDPFLVRGVEEIMRLFKELPRTRHYPYQFTCDVILYEPTHVAISISGVFWEYKQFISFVRNFVLIRNGDKFTITNEQLSVMNATNDQIDSCITSRYSADFPYFPSEYGKMELALGKLTNMNRTICQKFLYHCQYDLNKALQVFCEAFINDTIPSDVFAADGNSSNDDLSSFSDFIINGVSKTTEIVTEESVWNFMEMKRLKRCLYHKKVKSSVKKILHMRHKNKSSKESESNSKQIKTIEKPKKVSKLKPISFKILAPSAVKNKGIKRKLGKSKEMEEAVKENTEIGNKNEYSKSNETVDKSKPKTIKLRDDIFLKNRSDKNITSDKDAKPETITNPKKDREVIGTLKSKTQDEKLDTQHKSEKKKANTTKKTTNKEVVTSDKNKVDTIMPSPNVAQPEFQPYFQNPTNVAVNLQPPMETITMPWSNNTAPVVQPYQPFQPATDDQMNPQPFPYLQQATGDQMNPQPLDYNQFQPQFWNGGGGFQQPMFAQNNPYMFQPYQSAEPPMPQHLLPQGGQSFPIQESMRLEQDYYPYPFENMGGLTTPQPVLDGMNCVVPPGTEDVPGGVLQPQLRKNLQPIEINQELHHQWKGMDELGKMLHTVMRQLRTDNQSVTVAREVSINKCVVRMLTFVEWLESAFKLNGGSRILDQPVIVKRGVSITMDEDLAFSIMHVILHEMFEYESCKYDPNIINVNISDQMPLCSNKIYLPQNNQLLFNIRKNLNENQNVFNILRFNTAPIVAECTIYDDEIVVQPHILRVNNTFDLFNDMLKKAIEGSRGPLIDMEVALIKNLAQYVSTYFKDPSNILAKRRIEVSNFLENHVFRKGMKSVLVLTTESLVHIVIHEFIENSTCANNKSENFLQIPNLPPICHNTIYRPPFKTNLDDIRGILKQAELKQKFLYENKVQESPKMLPDPINESSVAFSQLLIDILVKICSENSIGNQQTLMDEYNLPFFARTIASLMQHLDNNRSRTINHDLLNGVVRLLDNQKSDTDDLTSPKLYLINLSKSIIHVTLHEMFERNPCSGYVPLPLKLLQVLKSLNENVPVEKLLCQDEIYQAKNENLRKSIRQCLSEIDHRFQILKLTARPFASIYTIYKVGKTDVSLEAKPAGQENVEDKLNQKKVEDKSNQEKAAEKSNQEKAEEKSNQEKAEGKSNQEKAAEKSNQEKAAEKSNQEKVAEKSNQEKAEGKSNQEKAEGKSNQKKAEDKSNQEKAEHDSNQKKAENDLNQKEAEDISNPKKVGDNSVQKRANDFNPKGKKRLRTKKNAFKNKPPTTTTDVQIHVDGRFSSPMNFIAPQSQTQPLRNVVNMEKHLLGKNVNKALIIHLLKILTQKTNGWPPKDPQTAEKIFEVLAESFILNIEDIIQNSTFQKDVFGVETKNDIQAGHSKIKLTDFCELDYIKLWINHKVREKYDTFIKEFNNIFRKPLIKMYAGLLHVVTHDIIEKSTCDNTSCIRNESGNYDIRSVICSDNSYKVKHYLEKIHSVIHIGEQILQSGCILFDSNIIILPPKLTLLFGSVPEKSLNLEVFLLKGIFIDIMERVLKKYFYSVLYPPVLGHLDELAEKMTFVIQHYYNVSSNKEGFTIGPLDAKLRRDMSPFLFYLAIGILDVIGKDFTFFKKRLSRTALIHQQISVRSSFLPVGQNLRRFVRQVLKQNMRFFPTWLELAYDCLEHFFNETGYREGEDISLEDNREELAKIIQHMLPHYIEVTPEDSSLIYHFAEKIYYFLKNIKLVNPVLPLTDTFYECLEITCLPDGPPNAQEVTRASQILVHMLTYYYYNKQKPLNYDIDIYYTQTDRKKFNKMKKCLDLSGQNGVMSNHKVSVLKKWMLKNWQKHIHMGRSMVPEERLECTELPVPHGISRKQMRALKFKNSISKVNSELKYKK